MFQDLAVHGKNDFKWQSLIKDGKW